MMATFGLPTINNDSKLVDLPKTTKSSAALSSLLVDLTRKTSFRINVCGPLAVVGSRRRIRRVNNREHTSCLVESLQEDESQYFQRIIDWPRKLSQRRRR